jgi:hypothetical protein
MKHMKTAKMDLDVHVARLPYASTCSMAPCIYLWVLRAAKDLKRNHSKSMVVLVVFKLFMCKSSTTYVTVVLIITRAHRALTWLS